MKPFRLEKVFSKVMFLLSMRCPGCRDEITFLKQGQTSTTIQRKNGFRISIDMHKREFVLIGEGREAHLLYVVMHGRRHTAVHHKVAQELDSAVELMESMSVNGSF